MASIDNSKRIKFNKTIEALTHTTTATGATVDTKGAESVVFMADYGTVTGTCTVQCQHAPDDGTGAAGTWVAVPNAELTTGAQPAQITTSNDNSSFTIGYKGGNRFVRMSITAGPTSLALSGFVITGHLRRTATGTP